MNITAVSPGPVLVICLVPVEPAAGAGVPEVDGEVVADCGPAAEELLAGWAPEDVFAEELAGVLNVVVGAVTTAWWALW
jgi:hypothetical protein